MKNPFGGSNPAFALLGSGVCKDHVHLLCLACETEVASLPIHPADSPGKVVERAEPFALEHLEQCPGEPARSKNEMAIPFSLN